MASKEIFGEESSTSDSSEESSSEEDNQQQQQVGLSVLAGRESFWLVVGFIWSFTLFQGEEGQEQSSSSDSGG